MGAVALPLAGEPDVALYPPSSGSVLLRRSWLERAGGYPAWLDYGEDLWLDRRIWSLGGWFAHAPGADVGIRPRSTPRAFARQYFNYAAGDGQAGMMTLRHAIRFGAYGLAAGLARRPNPARLALLLVLGAAYLVRPSRRPSIAARSNAGRRSGRSRPLAPRRPPHRRHREDVRRRGRSEGTAFLMSADTTRGRTRELDLSIVIVAYDVRELLLRCIESVAAALDGLRAEIWVVDNGSSLDSWDALLERHDVRVLRGAASLGFGRANNLAAGQARGRALLFLNPDTELPPGGVRRLLERLESEPTLGIVGPRLVLPDGSPDPAARRSFSHASLSCRANRGPAAAPATRRALEPTTWLSRAPIARPCWTRCRGPCMLVRRSAFEAIGGFDPGFFMYGEDLDFAYRARQAGWRTLYFLVCGCAIGNGSRQVSAGFVAVSSSIAPCGATTTNTGPLTRCP